MQEDHRRYFKKSIAMSGSPSRIQEIHREFKKIVAILKKYRSVMSDAPRLEPSVRR